MNVKEVMGRDVRTVRMIDRLDAAARAMWEQDCGAVPVVDGNGAVVGILTDRDVCMAAWTQGKPLAEIAVTAVMCRTVRTCKPDDAVANALALLQQHQLHRLPVVDARGVAVGMLTINDLLRVAAARPSALDGVTVAKALAAIGASRRPAATTAAPAKPEAAKADATKPVAALTAPLNKPAPAPAPAPAPIHVALPAIVKPAKAKGASGKGKKS